MEYNRFETAIHEKIKEHIIQKLGKEEVFAVRMIIPPKQSGIRTKITCQNPFCPAQEVVVCDMKAPFPINRHTSIIEFDSLEFVFHRPEIRYKYNLCKHCGSIHIAYDIEKYIDNLIEEI